MGGHYCTATACLSLVSGFVESQEGPRFFHKTSFARDGRDTRPPPSHLGRKEEPFVCPSVQEHLAARRLQCTHSTCGGRSACTAPARSDVYMIIISCVESGEGKRIGTCLLAC